MVLYALPALYALFIWWFSTGVIMYLDGLPRKTFKWSILGATVLMLFSLWGVYASRNDASVQGAYCAFSCGLLAWGWQEISFYMGYVTGTRKQPCPEGCSGWKHFGHAIQTSLWHELAIIAMGVVVVALTWGAKNQIGMWTFMVLWWMHQSAKAYVRLRVTRRLTLIKFSGPGLGRLGATAEVVHSGRPYDTAQAWSQALKAHRVGADGIAYTARHDDEAVCYALFDGRATFVEEISRQTDLDQDWFWQIAEPYGVGIAPG
jgi:hypothetical protein